MSFIIRNKKPVILGFFVFIGILLLIIGVIILGNKNNTFSKTYNINTTFKNVQGLQKGDKVLFLGVKIGIVKDITFIPDARVFVNMQIDRKIINYIKKNFKIRISSDGFIGNKILIIEDNEIDNDIYLPIENNDKLTSVNNIDTDFILQTFQNNNSNILNITDNLKKITNNILDENNLINILLNNKIFLESINNMIFKLNNKGDIIINEISNSLINLNILLKSINNGIDNKENIMSNIIYNIYKISNHLSVFSENTELFTKKIDDITSDIINDNNIKNIIINLEKSLIIVNDNLESIQNKFLFKHFMKIKK
ncbi:MAG: MCE family protein [Bacteroides sp.]|nr:MAG: MCE family protein [Bacteroides sp.]